MSAPRRRSALVSLVVLALAPGPVAADPPWREPLWLYPPGADAPFPALLTLPAGWLLGDAAVLVLPEGPEPGPFHHRVVEAMLAADAAVLELNPDMTHGATPGLPAAMPTALRPVLAAAFLALRRDAGAGLMAAIGLGPAGAVALRAAEDSAEGVLPPILSAAAALGGTGPARFQVGAAPPAEEQWPLRARLFCTLLAGLEGGAEARRRCEDVLLAPPAPLLAAWKP